MVVLGRYPSNYPLEFLVYKLLLKSTYSINMLVGEDLGGGAENVAA